MWLVVHVLLILSLPLSASAEYLGDLSANPFDSDSTANPFGAGSPFNPGGLNNPFSSRREMTNPSSNVFGNQPLPFLEPPPSSDCSQFLLSKRL